MSIYSGFATRYQEETYDDCVDSIIYILQKRLMKFYKREKADQEKFLSAISKIHTQMRSMEAHKYLQPKSSHTFQDLFIFLKKKQIQQASMFNENDKKSEVDSFRPSEIQKSRRAKILMQNTNRPGTVSNKIRTRNNSYSLGLKKNHTPTQFKIIHQSKNLPKKQERTHKSSNRKSISKSKFELQKDIAIEPFETHQTQKSREDKNEVHNILNNYIKRAKRQYSKGYKKQKNEIDNFVKQKI